MTQTDRTFAAELPETITSYLEAHQARRVDAAIGSYKPDAAVTDEGRTYTGHDEIRAWLARSASEYTYTMDMTGARRSTTATTTSPTIWWATSPAATVDLHFRFTLRNGQIARLVIEP